MSVKKNHLRNLVHFAVVDSDMSESEMSHIRRVGQRIGLAESEIESEISSGRSGKPILPQEEVLRYILLKDLFNLIAVDGIVHEKEVEHLRSHALEFGFETDVLDGLLSKLKAHVEQGFLGNDYSLIVEDAVFRKSTKNRSDEKYH